MTKLRIHKEWFQPLRKHSCPCGEKKCDVFAWGEYVLGKWRTIDHFCYKCFSSRVLKRLKEHLVQCGCDFSFVPRAGYSIPNWLKTPIKQSCTA